MFFAKSRESGMMAASHFVAQKLVNHMAGSGPGFVFLCDSKSSVECSTRMLLGLPKSNVTDPPPAELREIRTPPLMPRLSH